MKTRFVADWIIDMDDDGTDAQARSIHTTYAEAESAAFEGGRTAGVIEWARVREQQLIEGHWETVGKWTGDWDYLEDSM